MLVISVKILQHRIIKAPHDMQSLNSLHDKLLLCCLNIFNIWALQARPLSLSEIALAHPVFGDLLDYTKVRIFNVPFVFWQPVGMFIAPNGYIFCHPRNYSLDFSQESLSYQAIFIHELTHILQHQQGQSVLLKGLLLQTAYYLSFKKYNPYTYQLKENKAFASYNIEQQGDIARDIFLGKIPNILNG